MKVFIPIPRSDLGQIVKDEVTGQYRLETNPEWYLFFSRTIGGSTASDTEILTTFDSNIDPTAVVAQNAASDAQALAYLLTGMPKNESRNIEDAKLTAEPHPVTLLAETRKTLSDAQILDETNRINAAELAEFLKRIDQAALIALLAATPVASVVDSTKLNDAALLANLP